MKRLMLGFGIAIACVSAAAAGVVGHAPDTAAAAAAETWAVSGGNVGVRWNRELATDLGIHIAPATAAFAQPDEREHELFAVRSSGSLQFAVENGHLRGFSEGSLQASGGYRLQLPDGTLDLTNFRLAPHSGDPLRLDLLGADGVAWFYVNNLMYEMANAGRSFAVRTMDLRITPALANRLKQPVAANLAIADLALTADVLRGGLVQAPAGTCNTENGANCNWTGTPAPNGGTYQADLFMSSFTPQQSRCQGTCSGPNGAGKVVFTPSSSLKNNVNAGSIQTTVGGQGDAGKSTAIWAADIPWFEKFSGANQPYGNDQHPFLIWNMYRIDAAGAIHQIGRSGVKHAFVTINAGDCPYPFSHVLGRGCEDTYATGNNDSNTDLGPRSEIIPATNQWGRCGSIYDLPCTGSYHNPGNTNYSQRLLVDESQLGAANNAGSTWLFESWYLAREDINIYNSMGTVGTTQNWSGSIWGIQSSNYKLGPAIDRWVDPVNPPANAKNTELAVAEGHAKVAVKVTDLGNGKWRYNYAVMNFDFSRATTTGTEPNLRVLTNKGFDSFSVPLPAGVHAIGPGADVGDSNPNLNWRAQIAGNAVTWSNDASITGIGTGRTPPGTVLPTLDWGSLYSFSFIADSAPVSGNATLHVAQSGSPSSYLVATLVPAGGARITKAD